MSLDKTSPVCCPHCGSKALWKQLLSLVSPFPCSRHGCCVWLIRNSPAPVPAVRSVHCWGRRGVAEQSAAVCARSLPEAVAPLSAPGEDAHAGSAGRGAARGRGRSHGCHGEWAGVPPVATARRGQQRAPCRPACSCSRAGVSQLGHTGRGRRGEGGLPARRCHRRGAAGSARGLRQYRRCDGRLQERGAEEGIHPAVSYPGSLSIREPVQGAPGSWLRWWGFVVFLFPIGICQWQLQSLSSVWSY